MTMPDPPVRKKLTKDRVCPFTSFYHHTQPSTVSTAERMMIINERNLFGLQKTLMSKGIKSGAETAWVLETGPKKP